MGELLSSLIPGGKLAMVVAIVAAIVAVFGRVFWAGRQVERGKADKAKVESLEEQLEMHREADDIEKQVKDLPAEEKRKEAATWARPR